MVQNSAIKDIFENGEWYHTVSFNDFKSKGTFDYTKLVYELNFPNMDGKKILDVGCSDGFFSMFFLKDLNANFVEGVDFNKYDGSVAFEVLKSYQNQYTQKYSDHNDYSRLKDSYNSLGLKDSNKYLLLKKIFNLNMNFSNGSIYDLSKFPQYDITFCGSLLEHLRDPITAIEQLFLKTNEICIIDVSNTFKNNLLMLNKPYIKYTGSGGNFYHYSNKAIKSMMLNIGFKKVEIQKEYKIKIEKYNYKIPHTIFVGYK